MQPFLTAGQRFTPAPLYSRPQRRSPTLEALLWCFTNAWAEEFSQAAFWSRAYLKLLNAAMESIKN
jgi:hypothetical protein